MTSDANAPANTDETTMPKWQAAAATVFLLALLVGVGVVTVVGMIAGQDDDGVVSAVPSGPDGQAIYETTCVACHGASGEGGIGLPIGNGLVLAAFPDIADQISVITDGRNVMPAFAEILSAEEIEAVAVFEREQLGH